MTGVHASPVVLLLKVADGDEASPTAQGELVLQRRPFHAGGGPVDPDQHQGGLPRPVPQGPHVRVPVRRTRHNPVGLRRPVDACEEEMLPVTRSPVLTKLICWLPMAV